MSSCPCRHMFLALVHKTRKTNTTWFLSFSLYTLHSIVKCGASCTDNEEKFCLTSRKGFLKPSYWLFSDIYCFTFCNMYFCQLIDVPMGAASAPFVTTGCFTKRAFEIFRKLIKIFLSFLCRKGGLGYFKVIKIITNLLMTIR